MGLTTRACSTLVASACTLILTLALVLACYEVRERANDADCRASLQLIGLAIQQYAAFHGELPPAYATDSLGNRLHSWRVLLLPFLGMEDVYKCYRLDQAWDSPHNLRFLHDTSEQVRVFRCPGRASARPTCTTYLAVVGSNTMWQANKGQSIRLLDCCGPEVVLLVEHNTQDVAWTEPRDIALEKVPLLATCQVHRGGCYCLMGDFQVSIIPASDQFRFISHHAVVPNCVLPGCSPSPELVANRVQLLSAYLHDPGPYFRRYAAFYLGRLGPDAISAVPSLRQLLHDQDVQVRDAAATALRAISAVNPKS